MANIHSNIKRQPAGSPVGGQFAQDSHAKKAVVLKPKAAELTDEQIEVIHEQAASVYASMLSRYSWCKRNIGADDFQQLVYVKIATSSRDYSNFSITEMKMFSRTTAKNTAISLMRKYRKENANSTFENDQSYQPAYVDPGHELIKNQDSNAKMNHIKGWWSFAARTNISPRVKHHTEKEINSVNAAIRRAGGKEKLLDGWGNQPTPALRKAENLYCGFFESKEDAHTALKYIAENSVMWLWLTDASAIPDEQQDDLFDTQS